MKIVVISGSVRIARNSHRVALYFEKYISENKLAEVEILDLQKYKFPIFEERLSYLKDPSADLTEFALKVTNADGVIIITPEYNGGYPASLKNAIDVLYSEWKRKPVAIVTVSDGSFGGTQVITSLVFSLWKIGAWVVPAMYPVPKVQKAFNEDGSALDEPVTNKLTRAFLNELVWCIQATKSMQKE